MRRLILFSFLASAFAVFFTGCSRNNEELDKAAIRTLVDTDTVWFNLNTTVDSTGTSSTLMDTTKGIIWLRGPQTHDSATALIEVVGDSAWVEWSRHNYGKIGILALVGMETKDTLVVWEKDLVETAKVRGIYRRTGSESDSNRGWTLEKISCAVASSEGYSTVNIDSFNVKSQDYDLTITDPLNTFYDIATLVTFHSGENVIVTLYANKAETDAFIHSFILAWPFYVRAPFANQGNGVHEGTWHAQLAPFPRFAILDLLAHSTLWTEAGVYDFSGILFPYNIVWP
ncbi:hypothetical protein GX441_04230 [bacterium]|nr:hypothetical protein [bacterium]